MRIDAKPGEVAAVVVVALMSIAANLPDSVLLGLIDRRILLLALMTTVLIALFRYLRALLFLAVVVLAIGANLPEQLANSLGIDGTALTITLGLLAFFSLMNALLKIVPTGFEETSKRIDSPDSRANVMNAVLKGDVVQLQKLMALGVEVNFQENGRIPLLEAVELGYSDVVQILLHHGAQYDVRNAAGVLAKDIAMEKGYTRCANMLLYAAELAAGGKPAAA